MASIDRISVDFTNWLFVFDHALGVDWRTFFVCAASLPHLRLLNLGFKTSEDWLRLRTLNTATTTAIEGLNRAGRLRCGRLDQSRRVWLNVEDDTELPAGKSGSLLRQIFT